MRALGALLVTAGSAVLVGTAAAGPLPLPPVPTVTVPVPSAPVPLPVIPKLPTPVLAAAPHAHASSPPLPAVAGVSAPSTASNGPGPSSGVYRGESASGTTGPSSSREVDHFHSSRRWIGTSGPKGRRTTTFTFVLPRAGRVVFTVNQVSPACLGVGRFSVAGHAGLNRVRFAGRVQGRRLGPGTYKISARTASGRVVRRITLVVVGGSAPTSEELTSLRAANACRGGTRQAASAVAPAATGGSTGSGAAPAQSLPRPLSHPQIEAAGVPAPRAPNLHAGVLASSVQKTARAIRPLLVALLAISILLLGLASLPRVAVAEPRVNDLLARHRVEIAALGAMALFAVAIAFLLA